MISAIQVSGFSWQTHRFRCEDVRKGPSIRSANRPRQHVSPVNSKRRADSGQRDLQREFSSVDLREGKIAVKLFSSDRFGVECGFASNGIKKN